MAELKPCDCNKSVLFKAYNLASGKFRVFCGHCKKEGPEKDNLQQAINAWNGRIINEETNS